MNSMYTLLPGGRVQLHADHPVYAAHFPGQPVTPGAVLIQIVHDVIVGGLADASSDSPLVDSEACLVAPDTRLLKVTQVKFLALLDPREHPEVEVHVTSTAPGTYRATITATELLIARMTLAFAR